jgi:Zn-dependent protease
MFSLISSIGYEIPLSLFLMALLSLRAKVWPKASVFVRADAAKIFALLDMQDGKREDWGRTVIETEALGHQQNRFRKTYTTTLTTGTAKSFSALFSIRKRQPDSLLEIQREGLEGRSLNNELLSQTYRLTPEADGTRLRMIYEWGPRPFMAQMMARADLWGGIYRIKGLAETGTPNERPFQAITALIAIVTGAISMAAFAFMFENWSIAGLLIVALFVHEMGHLIAYRLIGQPWGRMVFLPFLGAIAMPRLPYESQGQAVFAALMGPGFSIILAIVCAGHLLLGGEINHNLAWLGLITTGLNIFNLLPVEPLDGGVALRSVLTRMMGAKARYGLLATGIAIVGVGFAMDQILIMVFGGIAILFNIKTRIIDAGLVPLSRLQILITFFGYVSMVTAYFTMLSYYYDVAMLLQPLAIQS